jgi:hypothetical protein
MCNINLSEDGVAVVGEDDAAHGVEQDLQHGLGAKGGSHDVGDSSCGLDVGGLGLATLLAFGILVQNEDWRS